MHPCATNSRHHRRLAGWALCLVVAVLAATAGVAGETEPAATVDHSLWGQVLRDHVRDGLVDYSAVKGDRRLAQYLDQLAALDLVKLSDEQRLATYLNAYNAFAVRQVAEAYPLNNVTDIAGFFAKNTTTLGGREVTLDQLENEFIRAFGDPRVHAAITCAAKGCPPLRSEPYTADNLEAQLEEQARQWVNQPTTVRIEQTGKTLFLSMIFHWYPEDFDLVGGPAGFVKRYINDPALQEWLSAGGYRPEFLRFDWTLNDLNPTEPAPDGAE